jgi:hypothetical protein
MLYCSFAFVGSLLFVFISKKQNSKLIQVDFYNETISPFCHYLIYKILSMDSNLNYPEIFYAGENQVKSWMEQLPSCNGND